MKNMKTILLLLSCILLFNISCDKEETPVEQEIIVQGKEEEEKEPEIEEEEEEEEPAEEIINNPDLELVGGQAAFNITPNGGTMSGGTSVNLRLVFDDFITTIPNEETEYQVLWKTNGIYGRFEDELIEVTTLEVNSMMYTSTNTEITNGEEKFVATLYSRPKGSEAEFELVGSSGISLTITNETNKKYMVVSYTFHLKELGETECIISSNPIVTTPGRTHFLYSSVFVEKISDAINYRLEITNRVNGNGLEIADRTNSWGQESTQFPNVNPDANSAAFQIDLYTAGLASCHARYGEFISDMTGIQADIQLIVTLE